MQCLGKLFKVLLRFIVRLSQRIVLKRSTKGATNKAHYQERVGKRAMVKHFFRSISKSYQRNFLIKVVVLKCSTKETVKRASFVERLVHNLLSA